MYDRERQVPEEVEEGDAMYPSKPPLRALAIVS